MFFYLSKLLTFLLLPFTWAMVLLLYAWFTKNEWRKKRAFLAVMLILLVFSNRFIFDRTMYMWEVPAVSEKSLGHYDAVIVLGGATNWDPSQQRIQFHRGADRIFQALTLWKKGYADKIVFTGGSGSILHPDHKEGVRVRKYLLELGIPDSVLIFENESKNTHENAEFLKPILKTQAPGGKYLLVTSGYHMRRSLGCFAKAGIAVSPYSTDRMSGPPKFEFDYAFIPDAETLFAWNALFREWFGCITYSLAGYI